MKLRCLIVDDSSSFLEAAQAPLEREGLSVAGADVIAASPAIGFLPKSELSSDAIRRMINGRSR